MSKRLSTAWVYSGIWGVMTRWFRVPQGPPQLPSDPGEQLDSFRPSEGFLRYLKFQFWVALFLVDAAIFVGWVILFYKMPTTALLLSPIAFGLAVLPDIVAYVAIHCK